MVRLSGKTISDLKDDIMSILYDDPLKPKFTNEIALDIRRDNEFTKILLLEMEQLGYVERLKKDNQGKLFIRRIKWKLPDKIIKIYDNKFKV